MTLHLQFPAASPCRFRPVEYQGRVDLTRLSDCTGLPIISTLSLRIFNTCLLTSYDSVYPLQPDYCVASTGETGIVCSRHCF